MSETTAPAKPYFWQVENWADDPDAKVWREEIDVMLLAIAQDVEMTLAWLSAGLDRGDRHAWITAMIALKEFLDNRPSQHPYLTIADCHDREYDSSTLLRTEPPSC